MIEESESRSGCLAGSLRVVQLSVARSKVTAAAAGANSAAVVAFVVYMKSCVTTVESCETASATSSLLLQEHSLRRD